MAKLNRREQTIMNYMQNGGNIKKAMIDAGYSETYADRNSKYLLGIIGDEIKKAQGNIRNDNIKSIEEVQQWWSEVMDDKEEIRKVIYDFAKKFHPTDTEENRMFNFE